MSPGWKGEYKLKKCLLIAYYFPPRPAIGSQRPSKLAKYFPEFGWEPIVLTAKLPGKPPAGMRVIETDYVDILASTKSLLGLNPIKSAHEQLNVRVPKDAVNTTWKSKAIKLTRDIIAYPDIQRSWYKYAIKSARKFLDNEMVDVILSTSSPVTSHIIARELKKVYKIPWIADLRDLWSQNHFNDKSGFIRYFEKQLELKTFALADAIVTVTPPFAEIQKILHKNINVYCITNGYDTDDFAEAQTELTRKFTITYTGIFYNGRRDPSLLFEALSMLINENIIDRKLLEVRFYGPQAAWLSDDIRKYDLKDIVNVYGKVPREKALEKQKESHLLLLLVDKNNNEKDVYPAKIFEYFGAGRPIVAIGGTGGAVNELLEKTNTGEFAADVNALKALLCKHYQQYITTGEVSCNSERIIENYSYKKIASKYSDILNEIVTK
jgi:glycosyltransferase involved in cell wall biosynthesis